MFIVKDLFLLCEVSEICAKFGHNARLNEKGNLVRIYGNNDHKQVPLYRGSLRKIQIDKPVLNDCHTNGIVVKKWQ